LDYSSLDDAALLALIARLFGNQPSDQALNGAVSALYDRHGRLIYNAALHLVGDVETAEEITQDVFVRACEGASGYSSSLAKVSTWLVSIARHRAIDELRRRSVRPEKERLDWPDDIGMDTLDGLPLSEGPANEVENSLQQRHIRQIVSELPPDQRQALGLAYFKGMSHSQIAAFLGEPLGTIKSRVRLGMQKLRDTFIEQGMIDPQ
jgi:RNA polymerase sigma-70 factor (ECF subfamily)